jgi:hypothetical protein
MNDDQPAGIFVRVIVNVRAPVRVVNSQKMVQAVNSRKRTRTFKTYFMDDRKPRLVPILAVLAQADGNRSERNYLSACPVIHMSSTGNAEGGGVMGYAPHPSSLTKLTNGSAAYLLSRWKPHCWESFSHIHSS